MAWCRQATSHYLSQCQPRSPYGSTRPQWVKWVTFEHISVINLQYVMRNCPQANTAGLHWWEVNTDSGNGLVPLGSKPLPESVLTKILDVTRGSSTPWHHKGLMSWLPVKVPYLYYGNYEHYQVPVFIISVLDDEKSVKCVMLSGFYFEITLSLTDQVLNLNGAVLSCKKFSLIL